MNINKVTWRAHPANMNLLLYGTQKDIFEVRNIKLKKKSNEKNEDEKRKVKRNNELYELHFHTNELFFLLPRIQHIAIYENVLINFEKLETEK